MTVIRKASDLDWRAVKNFSPGEWPPGVLEQMDARVIEALANIRSRLPSTHGLTPSPLRTAHVREFGASRHSVQGGARLSDATDFFARWDIVWDVWMEIQRESSVGGIGIYVDTFMGNPEITRPMFHIDMRPERLQWVCWRPRPFMEPMYTHLNRDSMTFFRILHERGRERRR